MTISSLTESCSLVCRLYHVPLILCLTPCMKADSSREKPVIKRVAKVRDEQENSMEVITQAAARSLACPLTSDGFQVQKWQRWCLADCKAVRGREHYMGVGRRLQRPGWHGRGWGRLKGEALCWSIGETEIAFASWFNTSRAQPTREAGEVGSR